MKINFPNNALSLQFCVERSVHNDGDDETVESEGFSENEDENHTNIHVFLGVSTDTGVSDDTDGESSSEGGETTAHATSEVPVSSVRSVDGFISCNCCLVDSSDVDDGDNEAVNSEDTSHNTGNEGLEDEGVRDHGDGADTDSRLGGTIGSSEVSEDEGTGDTHESEEGVLVSVSQVHVGGVLNACIIQGVSSSGSTGGHILLINLIILII